MTRVLLLAAVLGVLTLSSAKAELRTFDIEPQYQQEVFAALSQVLTPDASLGLTMDARGRVELLPSGQILVNASAETLAQVEQVLRAIRARATATAPRASMRYWAVLATPAQAGQASIGSPPPAALNDVLAELRRTHGELTFRVIGSAALLTASGQPGEVKGTTLGVKQTVYIDGDTLNAEIAMALEASAPAPRIGNVHVGDIELRTALKRGEFIVLGESHVQGIGAEGPLFYVVHWDE